MYYTYILYSERLKKYYTGQTLNLQKRLFEHNSGKTAFMKSGTPWILIKSFESNSRNEAMELEKKIKKRGAQRFLEDFS